MPAGRGADTVPEEVLGGWFKLACYVESGEGGAVVVKVDVELVVTTVTAMSVSVAG